MNTKAKYEVITIKLAWYSQNYNTKLGTYNTIKASYVKCICNTIKRSYIKTTSTVI